ncbi:hypothetical protein HK101_003268 [Irineochytrium annulatum]|nr:hypothetical protein HK101_003268 [Irineochytrium annulatum]
MMTTWTSLAASVWFAALFLASPTSALSIQSLGCFYAAKYMTDYYLWTPVEVAISPQGCVSACGPAITTFVAIGPSSPRDPFTSYCYCIRRGEFTHDYNYVLNNSPEPPTKSYCDLLCPDGKSLCGGSAAQDFSFYVVNPDSVSSPALTTAAAGAPAVAVNTPNASPSAVSNGIITPSTATVTEDSNRTLSPVIANSPSDSSGGGSGGVVGSGNPGAGAVGPAGSGAGASLTQAPTSSMAPALVASTPIPANTGSANPTPGTATASSSGPGPSSATVAILIVVVVIGICALATGLLVWRNRVSGSWSRSFSKMSEMSGVSVGGWKDTDFRKGDDVPPLGAMSDAGTDGTYGSSAAVINDELSRVDSVASRATFIDHGSVYSDSTGSDATRSSTVKSRFSFVGSGIDRVLNSRPSARSFVSSVIPEGTDSSASRSSDSPRPQQLAVRHERPLPPAPAARSANPFGDDAQVAGEAILSPSSPTSANPLVTVEGPTPMSTCFPAPPPVATLAGGTPSRQASVVSSVVDLVSNPFESPIGSERMGTEPYSDPGSTLSRELTQRTEQTEHSVATVDGSWRASTASES